MPDFLGSHDPPQLIYYIMRGPSLRFINRDYAVHRYYSSSPIMDSMREGGCYNCGASGRCKYCEGSGESFTGGMCPGCSGKGKCSSCDGTGYQDVNVGEQLEPVRRFGGWIGAWLRAVWGGGGRKP